MQEITAQVLIFLSNVQLEILVSKQVSPQFQLVWHAPQDILANPLDYLLLKLSVA